MAGTAASDGSGPTGRRVVVTFPLDDPSMARLTESLGGRDVGPVTLVDITDSDGSEDVVLVPSASRQLVGRLRRMFPSATLLIVEVEDVAHGVDLGGKVMQGLDAGADGYFVARSLDELATVIEGAVGRIGLAAAPDPAALEPARDEPLGVVLDAIARDRAPVDRGDSAPT